MSGANDAIVVVARWRLPAERIGEVLALLPELRRQTLAEPGCLGYEVLRSVEAPDTLVLMERYRDEAAIEAHRASPHYQQWVAGHIAPLLLGREVELLRPR